MSNEMSTKIYFIKGHDGYLKYGRGGGVSFFEDIGDGDSFSSESDAKACLGKLSRFGSLAEVIDCRILVGEFVPQESYKAVELIMKIPKWKKLFKVLVDKCSVSELLLLTSIKDIVCASKEPVYQHIKNIHHHFDSWEHQTKWVDDDKGQAFAMFKALCRYAMNEKFKQTQNP